MVLSVQEGKCLVVLAGEEQWHPIEFIERYRQPDVEPLCDLFDGLRTRPEVELSLVSHLSGSMGGSCLDTPMASPSLASHLDGVMGGFVAPAATTTQSVTVMGGFVEATPTTTSSM